MTDEDRDTEALEKIAERRDSLESHAEKDLPTSDLAEALLEILEEEQ